jgi:hypothetical protein
MVFTSEILRKIQKFVNRYLTYILITWGLRNITDIDLWKATGSRRCNFRKKAVNLDGLLTQ